ncbi:hypothetical protein BGZ95_011554 [Linnemannia exigua]|uniref:Uncharacterized protein n=1 Tax=Linnemannia exigua TaxID=604196 RepID=A0AAD4D9Q1_9FUNG|nr:hypothetical protein BGZ95_011554 [Linnemannia exigua]
MALDPSLGSFFAGTGGGGGGAYKPLSSNESDPDLSLNSSSGCEEGEEKGFNCGGQEGVEDLGISEAPYRRDDHEGGGGGYGRSGSDVGRGHDRATSRARAWATVVGGDANYRDDDNSAEGGAWARAMDNSNVPEVGGFTMPVTAPSSTLAFLKSYVPSLGGGASSDSSMTATSPTTTSPRTTIVTASQTSPATSSGGGFWSLRKMSMNFLSGNQYTAVGDKAAHQSDDDEEEEGNEREGQHRPREQGRRTGYRDDFSDHADDDSGRRELQQQRHGGGLSKEMRSITTMPTSPLSSGSGGLTVSYLTSMVQNATQVGAQYIPVQVRDQLPVSSRSVKKD